MAFTSVVTRQSVRGDKRVFHGTFENTGGDSGGDIATGLTVCEQIVLQHTGSSVVAISPPESPPVFSKVP